MHYIKVYVKGGVKNRFCPCKYLSITFEAIDSPERLSSKIYRSYFTFAYCLIFIPLSTIFKSLALWSLCLVSNNIDFALSCPK